MAGRANLKVCLTLTVLIVFCLTTDKALGKYSGGTGEPNDPYLIATAEDMNEIGVNSNDWDKHFLLVNDINLTDYTGAQFNIIGNKSNPFTGVFDGNGYTISNFTYTTSHTDCIGLFGYIYDPNAKIKNLTLVAPNVDAGDGDYVGSLVGWVKRGTICNCKIEGGRVSGDDYCVGGLIGFLVYGTVSDCYSSCSVSGHMETGGLVGINSEGTISSCGFNGTVSGDMYIGGLVGRNSGTISDCHTIAEVYGDYFVGGLVGYNSRAISNSSTAGYISGWLGIGGLVGECEGGSISQCYVKANIVGKHETGGLAGYITNGCKISNSSSDVNVSGRMYNGGLVGETCRSTIVNCYTIGKVSGSKWYTGGLTGMNKDSTISKCYSAAIVSGSAIVGGFVGRDYEGHKGSYLSCFWDNTVNPLLPGISAIGDPNVIGKTTAEMQTKNTFTDAGWDFITPIWTIEDNDYPRLWWEENILYVPGHYPTIQAAIDAAVDGDTVVVAPGTYTGPGNRDIDFKGKAITVTSIDPNDPNIVAATIIDCERDGRGFRFHSGETPSSVLDGLTIINGRDPKSSSFNYRTRGGGIYCDASGAYGTPSHPSISNCIFKGNSSDLGGAMSIWKCSPTVVNCLFISNTADDNGGGIYITASLHEKSRPKIVNCLFIENSARYGGGIYNYYRSNPNITNCIFMRNLASRGGAVFNDNHASPGFTNCTLSGNVAGQYGGGIYSEDYSTTTSVSCILWGNSDINGMSESSQIRSDGSCSDVINYCCIQGWEGDLGGTGNIGDDPCFVATDSNDFHLLPDSPCIDAGDPNYVSGPNETDIDGDPRIINGRIDIGADEYRIIYVDADATGNNNGSSWENAYNFLQDALADAKSSPKPLEIRVAQGIYRPDEDALHPNGTGDRYATFELINGVTLKGGYVGFCEQDLNVRDINTYKTILSGDLYGNDVDMDMNEPFEFLNDPCRTDNCYHVFYHPEGLNLNDTSILDGFTISGGNADGSGWPHNGGGGMLNCTSNPTIERCTFTANCAFYGGGGIRNRNSSPTMEGCTFRINVAYSAGGAMSNHSTSNSSPTVTNCIFSGNSGGTYGGGMHNSHSSPVVKGCAFSANSASRGGGMFNAYYSNPVVDGCTFTANSTGSGSGIYNEKSSPTIDSCTFSDNLAEYSGGGICNYQSSPTIRGCTFSNNLAQSAGGIVNSSSNSFVESCIFSGNRVIHSGGGMYNSSCSPTVESCTFIGNSAKWGGGMYNKYSSPKLKSCTFSGNSSESGGGISNGTDSSPTMINCVLSHNSATYGGGMYNGEFCKPRLTSSTFTSNSAIFGCALAYGANRSPSIVRVMNCILWDSSNEIWLENSTVTIIISYCNVQGGWSGTGNINIEPMFVAPDSNDFHLLPNSPCIDAGDPNSYFGLEPEPDGGRINMGAYGNTPEATCKGGLVLQSYNLVSKTRVDRTVFNYIYTMTLNNNSTEAVSNVVVELLDASDNVTILDPNVSFAYIEAGAPAVSDDTFNIVVDRSVPVDATIISWLATFDAYDSSTSSEMMFTTSIDLDKNASDINGDGEVDFKDLAELAEQWLGPPGIPSADIAPQPNGDGIVNFLDLAELAENWQNN